MNLAGTIDQAGLAGIAIDPFEHAVLGVAAGTIELDGGIDRIVEHIGDGDLGHGYFLAGEIALVELPGGLHDQ